MTNEQTKRARYLVLLLLFAGAGIGIVANPFVLKPLDALVMALGGAGTVWIAVTIVTHWDRKAVHPDSQPRPGNHGTIPAWPVLILILVLWVIMHRDRIVQPTLKADDYDYLTAAATWSDVGENLWVPYNEHLCPFARVVTWAAAAPWPEQFRTRSLAIAGMVLFATAIVLVYLFVRVETESAALAAAAAALFALSPIHREIVEWYSASLWSMSVHALLGGMICFNRWDRTGSLLWWIGAVVCTALGPFTFALGWLVGPVCTLYGLLSPRARSTSAIVLSSGPVLISVTMFIAIALLKAGDIVEKASYAGKPLLESVEFFDALLYGSRWCVDHLLLENAGIPVTIRRSSYCYLTVLPLLIILVRLHLVRSRQFRLSVVAVGCIIGSYALVLPFRTWVGYETIVHWTRYQLWAQLGVSLLLVAAFSRSLVFADRARLGVTQLPWLLGMIGVLFIVHGLR